ncbi:MAG: SGNH/GDSL hydrolase family protein [Treponema sp.]|nr:SGNH/GDSL hydrolase family protein [Treponema sp.]
MENGINTIAVYGDSILKGAVTGTDSGHLFDIIENDSLSLAQKKLGFEMNNLSVFGNIITKGQRKLSKMMERGEKFDLAILESGGNDCDYDWAPISANPFPEEGAHKPRTELSDFIRILGEMTSLLRQNKITPLIMTMPPLVPDWWFEHICSGNNKENILKFLDGNPHKLYENHERYNMELSDFARANNVQLVDVRKAMLSAPNYRQLMCRDGIHPNEKGYEYIAEIWIRELPKIKKEF